MNLANNPKIEQLSSLIAAYDDSTASHYLWVASNGDVHINQISEREGDVAPAEWLEFLGYHIRCVYELWGEKNNYVGEEASRSEQWINAVFQQLIEDWNNGISGYLAVEFG